MKLQNRGKCPQRIVNGGSLGSETVGSSRGRPAALQAVQSALSSLRLDEDQRPIRSDGNTANSVPGVIGLAEPQCHLGVFRNLDPCVDGIFDRDRGTPIHFQGKAGSAEIRDERKSLDGG